MTSPDPLPQEASDCVPEISFHTAGFTGKLFEHIDEVPKDWDLAAPQNVFLQRKYLTVLEHHPPRGMRFTYVLFYREERPVGVAYFQISHFRPDKSIRDTDTRDHYPCIIRAFARHLKTLVASHLDHNLLVCGNLLLTGEHGWYFDPTAVDDQLAFQLADEVIIVLQKTWEMKGTYIDGLFIKDIEPDRHQHTKVFTSRKYRQFTFHPNMVLHIDATWESFEDYLGALSSKYRVRVRRSFKAAQNVARQDLDLGFVQRNARQLYQLYIAVMDHASFNMVVLHEDYLPAMKAAFGDDYRITGYFFDNELIGFCSTLRNGQELEAHFIGFDEATNHRFQLYLNMLYDMLREGIGGSFRRVIYARTAMEIKSSVGAVPRDMLCFIKAAHPLTNKVLPHLMEYLRPPGNWMPRHPFR